MGRERAIAVGQREPANPKGDKKIAHAAPPRIPRAMSTMPAVMGPPAQPRLLLGIATPGSADHRRGDERSR